MEKRLREELALSCRSGNQRRKESNRGPAPRRELRLSGVRFPPEVRSLRGVWRAHYTPKLKKRTALLRKLKDVFRRHPSQPVDPGHVKLINPVPLRGWVNYFAVGHASRRCFWLS